MPALSDQDLPFNVQWAWPACYTIEFDRCLKEQPNSYPDCEQVLSVYNGPSGQAMHDMLPDMPVCESERPRIEAARQYLPECYTPELERCLSSEDPYADPWPACPIIWEADLLDKSLVNALPDCEEAVQEASSGKPIAWLLVGGGAVLVVGLAYAFGRKR